MSLVKRNSHTQSSEAIERMEVFLAWLKLALYPTK